MPQDQPISAEPAHRIRLLTSGEGAIGPAVLALGAVLLASTFGAVWWAHKAAFAPWHGGPRQDDLTGIGAISAGALLLVWFVYRRLRTRLSAVLAIHAALSAATAGEKDPAMLSVNPDLGPEAQAWNRLIGETEKLRRSTVAERARQLLDRRAETRSAGNSVCDVLPQGIIVTDEQGKVTYANGASASFLRSKTDQLSGADFASRVGFDVVANAFAKVMASDIRPRMIVDVERKDDDTKAVLRFNIRPLRREDAGAVMIVIEDITQQKCAEGARHQFVAQATHELRTPLTNIRLYTEMAIEEGETDAAKRAKCLNVINSETRRLERIVGEMLSVAEIEAGSLKLAHDDVQLESLLADVRDDYQQAAAEKQIEFVLALPAKLPAFKGDRDKILLALHNLIGNALKYTPANGRVELQVDANDKVLTARVRDNGFGISEADVEKIFDRFYRAKDARVSKLTGSGIGLTLAREVVRMHGGDITVDSRLNQGSCFTMTLPIAA